MTADKPILDATCGSRMMHFDKENPLVLFTDKRTESHVLCDGYVLNVEPDIEVDFTNMPFPDNTFYLIVFDPPQILNLSPKSLMALKYGVLLPDWKTEIKAGFDECMRVLKPNGTLIFKWNEARVKLNEVLDVIQVKPLFGHTTGKHGRTIWMTFFKAADNHETL